MLELASGKKNYVFKYDSVEFSVYWNGDLMSAKFVSIPHENRATEYKPITNNA